MRGRTGLIAGLLALGLAGAAVVPAPEPAAAAPLDDRVLPAGKHTSEKGKTLAAKHARALRDLNAEIYHCFPWLEVGKEGIGFYKPKHLTGDLRYLSLNIYIEQEPSPQFASLSAEQRASAMFSRYVGAMLRRMTRSASVLNDDAVDGFTVILEWLKQVPTAAGQRPIHETIAVFVEKVDAAAYLSARLGVRDLASRARVLGFDGETPLGALKLSAWDDDFVSAFKVKNYEVERGVTCQAQ